MKVTTGYEFQGYYITEYLDVIFDEILVGMGLFKSFVAGFDNAISAIAGSEATTMIDKLNTVKEELRDRVIRKAKALGANALIGIDFESSKLGDLIMVSMTATAVKVEKIASPLPVLEKDQKRQEEEAQKEKAQREYQEKIAKLKAQNLSFDAETFVSSLSAITTTKEMVAYIRETAEKGYILLTEDAEKTLQNSLSMERMYGSGTGKQNIIQMLKELLALPY